MKKRCTSRKGNIIIYTALDGRKRDETVISQEQEIRK
jgi:hypothetical protein